MRQSTQEFFGGFYDWLNGPDPYPQIDIELRDWKHNIQISTIPVMEIVLEALPGTDTGYTVSGTGFVDTYHNE